MSIKSRCELVLRLPGLPASPHGRLLAVRVAHPLPALFGGNTLAAYDSPGTLDRSLESATVGKHNTGGPADAICVTAA